MSERLTNKETLKDMDSGELPFQQGTPQHIYFMLGKLEDIMEKYSIESVEHLDIELERLTEQIQQDKFNYNNLHKYKNELQHDRDTWKKACELACEWISEWGKNITRDKMPDYFYQQAQKEKSDV